LGCTSLRLARLLIAGACLAACSTSETEEHGAGAGLDVEAFVTEFASEYCDAVTPCCDELGFGHIRERCEKYLAGNTQGFEAAIQFGVPFDQAAAAACIQEIRPWLESCRTLLPPVCNRILVGTEPPGGSCGLAYECVLPEHGIGLCWGGECRSVEYVGVGEACLADGMDPIVDLICDAGSFCNATGTCEPLPDVGEACRDCSSTCDGCRGCRACAIEAYCDGVTDGTCQRAMAVGEPCTTDEQCVYDAYCDGGTCALRKMGQEPCMSDKECLEGCASTTCAVESGPTITAPLAYPYWCVR